MASSTARHNLLTNNGLITSINQIAGNAMTATSGNDTVDNYGTMIGSINLGAGVNAFNNRAGGLFDMGANVMLGTGNFLTNNGTMSPGGVGNVFTSAVTGNLVQSTGATYLLDLDFGPSTADRINATGTGSLAGKVTINLLNKQLVSPGEHQMTIVSAAGGVTNPGLTLDVASSAILTYKLLNPTANDLVLDYNVSFNPVGLPAQFASIGNAINAIQTARSSPGFAPIAFALFDLPDQPALTKFYNAVGGGGTAATQQASFSAGAGFSSMMFGQMTSWLAGTSGNSGVVYGDNAQAYAAASPADAMASTAFAGIRNTPRVSRIAGVPGLRRSARRQLIGSNAASGAPGSSAATSGGGMGIERQFGDNAVFGFSAGGSNSTYSVADRSTNGRIDGGHLGVYGAVRDGPLYLSGNLGYSRFANTMTRGISVAGLPSEVLTGDFSSDQFSATRRTRLAAVDRGSCGDAFRRRSMGEYVAAGLRGNAKLRRPGNSGD